MEQETPYALPWLEKRHNSDTNTIDDDDFFNMLAELENK